MKLNDQIDTIYRQIQNKLEERLINNDTSPTISLCVLIRPGRCEVYQAGDAYSVTPKLMAKTVFIKHSIDLEELRETRYFLSMARRLSSELSTLEAVS